VLLTPDNCLITLIDHQPQMLDLGVPVALLAGPSIRRIVDAGPWRCVVRTRRRVQQR
jgi:hypothetical protein